MLTNWKLHQRLQTFPMCSMILSYCLLVRAYVPLLMFAAQHSANDLGANTSEINICFASLSGGHSSS